MFDLFLKTVGAFYSGWWHFQRLGHFLRKGMKPFPALDVRPLYRLKYPYKCLIVNGAILSQQKSGEVALVQGMPFQKQCSTYFSRVCVICNNSLIL